MKKIIWGLLVIMTMPIAFAGSIKVYPTADAYTDSSEPSNSFNDSNLRVGYDANHGKHRSYLKFNLSGLDDYTITSAKFSVDPVAHVGTLTAELHYVASDTWKESTVSWNNAPAFSPAITDSKVIDSNDRAEFDVAPLMNEADNKLSFMLKSSQESTSNLYVSFFSKEHVDEFYRPYINVTFEGGECNTAADANCDGCVSLIEYNDFKYGYKNGLLPDVTLTEYNDIKYSFKNGLLTC